jgi:hypothetical protein
MAARANRTTRPKGAAQAKRAAQAKGAAQAQPGPPAQQANTASPAETAAPAPGQPAKQSSRAKRAAPPVAAQAAPSDPAPHADPAASGLEPHREPKALRLAAAAQAIEAVGVAVAGVFAAVSTIDGRSYTTTNGIALTLFLFVVAAFGVALAVGLSRVQPWSRVPAALVQLVVIVVAIALLDGHRPEWGVPALALAAACLVGLFTPASLRALNRQLD